MVESWKGYAHPLVIPVAMTETAVALTRLTILFQSDVRGFASTMRRVEEAAAEAEAVDAAAVAEEAVEAAVVAVVEVLGFNQVLQSFVEVEKPPRTAGALSRKRARRPLK